MPATAEVRRLPNPADIAIERAVMDAMRGLARFSPTRVIGPADAADAENLKTDLMDLCGIVDPLVKAMGAYAAHHFQIDPKDRGLFADQLRSALDGNATYVLQSIADRMREDDATSRRERFSTLARAD